MPQSRPIYYNPNLDIIYLGNAPFEMWYSRTYSIEWLKKFAPLELDAIQSLEIHASSSQLRNGIALEKTCLLHYFPQLRFLNIIDIEPVRASTSISTSITRSAITTTSTPAITTTTTINPATGSTITTRTASAGTITTTTTTTTTTNWHNPDIWNRDFIRAFIRKRQEEDTNWSMPSIRFAPPDKDIQNVLEHWPEDRREGKDGQDPFTDADIRALARRETRRQRGSRSYHRY
jgi:hypothetical protein